MAITPRSSLRRTTARRPRQVVGAPQALEQSAHRLAHLRAGRVLVVGPGDDHRRLVERSDQDMRQRSGGLVDQPSGVDRPLERRLEQPERVVAVGRPPHVPPEHGRAVDQHDLLHLVAGARIQERVGADHQRLPRIW